MNVPLEVILAVTWGFIGILVWIWNQKTKTYDQHLRECNSRRVNEATADATIQERICVIERNSNKNGREIQWVGDCIIEMGAKLRVELPDRPE